MPSYIGFVSESYPSPPGDSHNLYFVNAPNAKEAWKLIEEARKQEKDKSDPAFGSLFPLKDSRQLRKSSLIKKLELVSGPDGIRIFGEHSST